MCTVFLLGISGNYTADVKLTPIIKSVRGSIYLLEAMSGGRLHWSNNDMRDCGVRDVSIKSQCVDMFVTAANASSIGYTTLMQSVGRHGFLYSVGWWMRSYLSLSHNNKWRRWMWMVADSHLVLSEGWRTLGAEFAFIKWMDELTTACHEWQHYIRYRRCHYYNYYYWWL